MERKVIQTDSRRYTFEADRSNSGQCHLKATISTLDLSPFPSLTPNPGRHEYQHKESSSYKNCMVGMVDFIKEEKVLTEATEWAESLS